MSDLSRSFDEYSSDTTIDESFVEYSSNTTIEESFDEYSSDTTIEESFEDSVDEGSPDREKFLKNCTNDKITICTGFPEKKNIQTIEIPFPKSGFISLPTSNKFPFHRKNKTNKHREYSYQDTMRLIDDIFLMNYWDKKNKHATLVNSYQIKQWTNYFKNVEFTNIKHIGINKIQKIILKYINNIHNNIEDIILNILALGNGKISLCGGSIVNLLSKGENVGDWDLFFHNVTIEEADELLDTCLQYLKSIDKHITYSRSLGVLTVNIDYDQYEIQFIKRIYETKDQILLGFDLASCRLGFNLQDGLFATICGGLAIATGTFPLDLTQRSTSFRYRLDKYVNRGFSILIPGIDPMLCDNIHTPDGVLSVNKNDKCYFIDDPNKLDSSDYTGENYMNYHMISKNKLHYVTFTSKKLDDVMKLNDDFVTRDIKCTQIFQKYKNVIDGIKFEPDRNFLGDKYEDFVRAICIENNQEKAKQIWRTRGEWYIKQGLECAKLCKEEPWKYKDPGSQSFGKFSPIIEDPRKWYGDNYQTIQIGLKMDRFQAWMDCIKNIDYINNVPQEILKYIQCYWFKTEVDDAYDRLFKL